MVWFRLVWVESWKVSVVFGSWEVWVEFGLVWVRFGLSLGSLSVLGKPSFEN